MQHRTLDHWFLVKQEILLAWRSWRASLGKMENIDDVYTEVAQWWEFVPMVNNTINPWNSEIWPDPWTLVCTGEFCPSAQGLGMFYSLALEGYNCELVLAIIDTETKLIVQLPDGRLLNHTSGEIVDNNHSFQFINKWAPSDLKNLIKV